MQASLAQLARVVIETARLTELGQQSESASQRAVAESLDALARSRDLLASTSALIPG
jgi:hypothetical protein